MTRDYTLNFSPRNAAQDLSRGRVVWFAKLDHIEKNVQIDEDPHLCFSTR